MSSKLVIPALSSFSEPMTSTWTGMSCRFSAFFLAVTTISSICANEDIVKTIAKRAVKALVEALYECFIFTPKYYDLTNHAMSINQFQAERS
jgi:hypothetical protein